jgi:hypothetical protein
MSETIQIRLTLERDTPNTMHFEDTYAGLDRIWYRFSADEKGNIELRANEDGYEHLARYFLKMARSGKNPGYHAHHSLEFGGEPNVEPELTIGFAKAPDGFFGPSRD